MKTLAAAAKVRFRETYLSDPRIVWWSWAEALHYAASQGAVFRNAITVGQAFHKYRKRNELEFSAPFRYAPVPREPFQDFVAGREPRKKRKATSA